MKNRTILVCLWVFACIVAIITPAPTRAEESDVPSNILETRLYRGGNPSAKLYLEKSLTEELAVSLVAFKTRGWNEATIGLVYYITPEMSVGLGGGISQYAASNESTKSSHKTVSGFWYWKNDAIEAEVTVERYSRDPKPWYYNIYGQVPVSGKVSVGIFGEKYTGWGPRVSFAAHKNFTIWVSPILKKDRDSEVSLVVGAQIPF